MARSRHRRYGFLAVSPNVCPPVGQGLFSSLFASELRMHRLYHVLWERCDAASMRILDAGANMMQFVKNNAVLLALVLIVLFQQSEIKEMERTLNYIYAAVQANNDDIQLVQDEVWAISDVLISVHSDEERVE